VVVGTSVRTFGNADEFIQVQLFVEGLKLLYRYIEVDVKTG
jgi:hypothetical protein